MQYEPLTTQSLRRFFPRLLPHEGEVFQAAAHDGPLLEWSRAEDGAELLGYNGTPLVRLDCRDRRWFFSLIGSDATPIRSGSRAEARLLAECYARRTAQA
ncbi:hypothetical protein [Xanthobacter autotrophicus]|uniref:hypothetical protein n=1 Tax=Xanthobacter autotrophicus TaxID=280 RepID=UPI0024A63D1B|nr:hypothetical protein [Xanthobacter autotrophicus]MDI4658157.1 hypothetical protein [Xanthobacter autotrophicus]